MVLAHHIKNWLDKKDQEFRDKLRAEGRTQNQQAWTDWLARKEDAESRGQPFTEPPPNGNPS